MESRFGAEWLLMIVRGSGLARITHLLCELACRYEVLPRQRSHFPLHLTQSHVRDAVGLTTVHVNRMFRQLRQSGSVTIDSGYVTILDWHPLGGQGGLRGNYMQLGNLHQSPFAV